MPGDLCGGERILCRIRAVRNSGAVLRGVTPLVVVCCLVTLPVIGPARSARAQPNGLGQDAVEPADDLQRLPSDRKVAQQLQELTRLARGGNVAKIRDTLQLLQAADPSLMVPDGSKTFRPLHRDLIERIQSFSPELQSELLKDPGATSQSLQVAFANGGPVALVAFLHRHSGSKESLKAHLFLATIHRDRGHRQATMYWLSPLLHSGTPPDLQQIAISMRDDLNSGSTVQTNSETDTDSPLEQIPDEDESEDSKIDPLNAEIPAAEADEPKPDKAEKHVTVDSTQDVVALDTASPRNIKPDAGIFPHSPAWQQILHLSSAQRRMSQDLVRLLAADDDQPAIAWIAGEPVVDAQAVYVRSSGGVLAYDRITGRVLWTRLLDRQQDVRRMPEARLPFPDGNDQTSSDAEQLQSSREILELHRDEITARMTSDVSRLFAICHTGDSTGTSAEFSEPLRMLQRRSDLESRSLQELVAIEKATGRRLWSAGGAPMEARFGNELSRAWFAGPPTVSAGMLFGLVEQGDAHWLVCLRCETGEVVWKLMLAYPETNVLQDPYRQLTASRPLVADGMIWTSTNDGWLIGVDALTRSVIWSRSMSQKQSEPSQLRNMRRSAMFQIRSLPPFRECWRPEAIQLMSDSLLITGPDSHQLVMIDPLTGSVRRRISPEAATVILSVDEESIIVAGPKTIQRLRLDNFNVVWATKLTATDVAPTGPGTRLDNRLLIPLSDGSIQIVRYTDGQLTDNIPALRPAFSAGGLMNIEGDLVSYGLDHVSLFSQSGTSVTLQPEPIRQARFLIETGLFADAERILADFTPTSEQTDAIHRLLFRIATARTLNDPIHRDDHLQNAARYATTSRDKAIVQFLTLETKAEVTGDLVVEFLKAAPAVLNVELPNRSLLKEQLLSPVADNLIDPRSPTAEPHTVATRPMRHGLLQLVGQHLTDAEVSTSAPWLVALKRLSDADVLSIGMQTAVLRDELLRRAEDAINVGRLTESTWHLLLQARHCDYKTRSTQSDLPATERTLGVFRERFASLVNRFRNQLAAEVALDSLPLCPHPAALNLLAVVQTEILPTAATEKSPAPHEVLAEQWCDWKVQNYSVVPVNPVSATTMPQPNERMLSPRCREDRFLSASRWSTYSEPSVLAVRSLLRPDEPLCTIDGGMFDSLSFANNGSVVRYGSVVLVQNEMGLSAVSIIDQRVLWSRRIPNQSSRVMWQMMAEMQLFNSFFTALPAWQEVFGRDLRICGGNDRWICVQSPSRVEMIDLLTGQNLWSLPTQPGSQYVFATESCVFLSHLPSASPSSDPESLTCLNRLDGTKRESKITPSQLRQTILATADELLIWEQPHPGIGAASLNWINSVTGEKRHSLALNNMLNCQFMDVRTLVSVTSEGTFEVIDLLTTQKQVVQFTADVNSSGTAEKGTTPEHLSKAVIVADPANYYVFPFPDRQAGQMQMMLGSMGDLNLYPIQKELRAIDRATGKIRWVREAEENTAAWFEPTAEPVLLLVNFSARKNKDNAPRALVIPGLVMPGDRRTTITALSRISGMKLFDYTVSSRFPVPGLEFKITPQQHLDLQAFGNRVRFIPEPTPTPTPAPVPVP